MWLVFFETQGKYGAIENIYWRGNGNFYNHLGYGRYSNMFAGIDFFWQIFKVHLRIIAFFNIVDF